MQVKMYTIHFVGMNRIPGYCYVETREQDGKNLVIATSPDTDDMGPSVTNAWPILADEICKQLRLDPTQPIIWVEHYPERGHRKELPESWDQVFLVWDGRKFQMAQDRHPWKHLREEDLQTIFGNP